MIIRFLRNVRSLTLSVWDIVRVGFHKRMMIIKQYVFSKLYIGYHIFCALSLWFALSREKFSESTFKIVYGAVWIGLVLAWYSIIGAITLINKFYKPNLSIVVCISSTILIPFIWNYWISYNKSELSSEIKFYISNILMLYCILYTFILGVYIIIDTHVLYILNTVLFL